MFTESEMARAYREIRQRDPRFDMVLFLQRLKKDVPVVIKVRLMCTPASLWCAHMLLACTWTAQEEPQSMLARCWRWNCCSACVCMVLALAVMQRCAHAGLIGGQCPSPEGALRARDGGALLRGGQCPESPGTCSVGPAVMCDVQCGACHEQSAALCACT